MKSIDYETALNLENPVFIDVRSPGEYEADHIPNSVNVPLFDNHERSEIGILYKNAGQDKAILRGTDIVGSKLGRIIEDINVYRDNNIVINCFRGGMRSESLTSLLNSLGFSVFQLSGGYKEYRRYVRESLSRIALPPKVFILQGFTGVGKTHILNRLPNSVDLEGMAGHRSSVFGGIGLHQNTQKGFESLLLGRLEELMDQPYMVFEGESRKVGNLHIPEKIDSIIHSSPAILIEAPMNRRVEIILKEYTEIFNPDEVIAIVQSIKRRIGKKTTDILINNLRNRELEDFTSLILETYYDPLYYHTMKNADIIAKIENHNIEETAKEVEKIIEDHLLD